MSAPQKNGAARKPPIHISDLDYDRIASMALRLEHNNPDLAHLLLDEIERARVYPVASLPKDVVALGSEVEFADDLNVQVLQKLEDLSAKTRTSANQLFSQDDIAAAELTAKGNNFKGIGGGLADTGKSGHGSVTAPLER